MMHYVIGFATFFAAFVIGAFGFAQIIGCLQNVRTMKWKVIFPMVLWAAILVGSYFLMKRLVPEHDIWYYVGLGVSLLQTLSAGKIS